MPLIQTLQTESHISIYLWHVTETPEELSVLTGKDILALARQTYKAVSRQQELMVEHLLVRQHFSSVAVELRHHANGAPFLTDTNHHVSISHTKGYVAMAVGETDHFGIDIETLSPRVDKVLRHFMRPDEHPAPQEENTVYHLVLWSAKESLFKSLMTGEVNTMLDYKIPPFPLKAKGMFPATIEAGNVAMTVHYLTASDYVMTLAERDS